MLDFYSYNIKEKYKIHYLDSHKCTLYLLFIAIDYNVQRNRFKCPRLK